MSTAKEVEIPEMPTKTVEVPIVGTSLLCQHRWSEKARKQIRDKQTGKATEGQDTKDPELNARSSLHIMDDSKREAWNQGEIDKSEITFVIPAIAFKKAMVRGAKQTDYLPMTDARGAFFVMGVDHPEKVTVEHGEDDPYMREDMVRVGRNKADIRYRGAFDDWAATLRIEYNSKVVSVEQVIQIVELAGYGVGVGEYRPENDGQWGRFQTKKGEKMEEEIAGTKEA